MPIIKQLNATKFRSLKYGNDTSDGGSSRQPYMKVELKDLDKPFTRLRLTKFDDGLIRGGAVGALNASAVDTLRISKFLTDLPKGPLFLVKQVGLQLSNPRLEAKKGATGFLSGVGPTRIYNLGINTIAQVPLNAFGGHLMRHGLLPVMNDNTKYLSVVSDNNKFSEDNLDSQNNRLVALANKFDLGDGETEVSVTLQDAIRINRQNNRDGRQANREANRQGRQDNREANRQGRQANRETNRQGRQDNRELNKINRQANRDRNRIGRKINRDDNRDIRNFNRDLNRENRKINRAANKQGRQNNRLVNQSTREGARVEGFDFTRSKFERTSYERSELVGPTFERESFDRSEFERSTFDRSVFHRTSFKRNKINISDYTVDNYLGGPGSVYGIGRTIINRYNFTEDKIKIDQAFENARIETIRGSLLVDPLTEGSGFEMTDGSYTTGAITVPFITTEPQTWSEYNKEDNQFKALARKKQPESFYYNGSVSELKLQKAIGDGNITVDAQSQFTSLIWDRDHKAQINPSVSAPGDKFSAVKRSLDYDSTTKKIKYYDENPTYIGGIREIKVEEEINITGTGAVDTRSSVTKTVKGKTQSELDKLIKDNLQDYSQVEGNSLNSITVGRKIKKTKVKASIVDVSKKENNLKEVYVSGSMVSSPITEIQQQVDNGESYFLTEKVLVNRDAKRAFYFNGKNEVSNFDRYDPGIMSVHFNSIDPFTATNLSSIWFSAYMSGFKYGATATWNPVKYVGRSESFYTFTETKRDVSFNLQIPCFNKVDLLENHSKLSELQSVLAGTYSTENRLGGIITAITLGSYLVGEPGILTSVSFDVPDTSSWDLDVQLAMYLNAQFSFTIIGKALPEFRVGGFMFGKPKIQPKEEKPKVDPTKGDSEQKVEEKFSLKNLSNLNPNKEKFSLKNLSTLNPNKEKFSLKNLSSLKFQSNLNPSIKNLSSLTGKSTFSLKP